MLNLQPTKSHQNPKTNVSRTLQTGNSQSGIPGVLSDLANPNPFSPHKAAKVLAYTSAMMFRSQDTLRVVFPGLLLWDIMVEPLQFWTTRPRSPTECHLTLDLTLFLLTPLPLEVSLKLSHSVSLFSTSLLFGTDLSWQLFPVISLFSFFSFLFSSRSFCGGISFSRPWQCSRYRVLMAKVKLVDRGFTFPAQHTSSSIFRSWRKTRRKTGPETRRKQRCVLASTLCPFLYGVPRQAQEVITDGRWQAQDFRHFLIRMARLRTLLKRSQAWATMTSTDRNPFSRQVR